VEGDEHKGFLLKTGKNRRSSRMDEKAAGGVDRAAHWSKGDGRACLVDSALPLSNTDSGKTLALENKGGGRMKQQGAFGKIQECPLLSKDKQIKSFLAYLGGLIWALGGRVVLEAELADGYEGEVADLCFQESTKEKTEGNDDREGEKNLAGVSQVRKGSSVRGCACPQKWSKRRGGGGCQNQTRILSRK